MFVSCGNCDAEYQLDDAKIPAGGARMRCKNCDQYIVITAPEPSDLQAADDLAHEAVSIADPDPDPVGVAAPQDALADEAFSIEDPDPDPIGVEASEDAFADEAFSLEDPDPDPIGVEASEDAFADEGFSLEDPDPDPIGVAASQDALADEGFSIEDPDPDPIGVEAPEDEFDLDDESDWEFNDVVETPESEAAAESAASVFDRDGEWGELSKAEDVVDDLLGTSGPIDSDAAAAVDDLLGEIDTVNSGLGESGGELTADPGADPASESDVSSANPDRGNAEAADESSESRAADGDASLGDLSDWDMFDQSAESDASVVSAGSARRPASAARDGTSAEPRVEIAVAMVEDPPISVRWTDRISEIAGWGAVSLMMIVALVGGLASKSSDARAPAGSWSGAGFEADQIVGRWVDNAVAGSIYVVSGRIRGAPGSSRTARKPLGIRLIDTMGREIDLAPIPLAPAIPEKILRESSPAELDAFQARRARQIAAVGESWVSFEAVLTELPRFAGRFELQAVDH